MSSGEGTLGICDACRGYITEAKDGRVHQIHSLASRGYKHTLCALCADSMCSFLNIINFTLALSSKAS